MVDNTFVAFFADYSTAPWTPLTGLSVTFTLVNVDNGSTVVNDLAATEIGGGFYKYVATGMSEAINYAYVFDPNDSRANLESWVTGLLFKAIKEMSWIGMMINNRSTQYDFGATDRKNIEKLLEKSDTIEGKIDTQNSDISEGFNTLGGKIDSIEIPEFKFEEKVAKDVKKIVSNTDKLLKEYVDERKEEKKELGLIAEEFTRIEMEEAMKEKEKELEEKKKEEEDKRMEEEQDKKELELIQAEFDKQDEEEKVEKRKELEKELEEIEKEKKDIEKELNSLK